MAKVSKQQLAAYAEAHGFNASVASVWPRLSKAAEGGIQHLVSVDNGAYYAELWGRDGSYYAVTGAGVYQMPGLAKGAKLEEALDVFLEKVVGKRQDGVPLSALRKMAVDVAAEAEQLEKHVTPGKPHTDRSGHWHQDVAGHSVRVPGRKSEAHIYQNPPATSKAELEKHEAPQEHGSHPHGDPPTAPPNWKPKKLIGGTSSHQRAAERHFAGQTPAPITKDAGIPKPKASTPPASPPTTPASLPRSSSPREPHTEFSPQSTPQGPRGKGSRGGYPPKKTYAQLHGYPKKAEIEKHDPGPTSPHPHGRRYPKDWSPPRTRGLPASKEGYPQPRGRFAQKGDMPSSIPVSTEPVAKAEPATSKPMTHWHGEHQHTHPNEGPHSHGSDAVVVTPPVRKDVELNDLQYLAKYHEDRVDMINKTTPIVEKAGPVYTHLKGDTHSHDNEIHSHPGGAKSHPGHPVGKARTYLGPGQTAPEGSEEQEGERGGRYYEPTAQSHKPSVHTEKYEGSHAKKPKGYGGWAFQYDDDSEPHFFHGNYADAKKQAVAEARKRGVNRVHALP